MCDRRWDFSFPLQNRAKLLSTRLPFWVRRDFLPRLFLISLFFGRRPSVPPPVPVEGDARIDDLRLSAPTSPPPRAHAPILVSECSGRREARGVARARWRGTVSEGESRGHCAHPGDRVFRKRESGALHAHRRQTVSEGGRAGRVVSIPVAECFEGRELGVLCASTEAGALIVRGRWCGVCRERWRSARQWMRPLSAFVCCVSSLPFCDDLRYPLPTRTPVLPPSIFEGMNALLIERCLLLRLLFVLRREEGQVHSWVSDAFSLHSSSILRRPSRTLSTRAYV
jgi:hypothetical protein